MSMYSYELHENVLTGVRAYTMKTKVVGCTMNSKELKISMILISKEFKVTAWSNVSKLLSLSGFYVTEMNYMYQSGV